MLDLNKRDDSKSLIVSLVDAQPAPDGEWRKAYSVNDGGTLQLRDLMLCNPSAGAETFGLMIAPSDYVLVTGTIQPYVVYLVELDAGASEIVDLTAAVSAKWNVYVYGSSDAINYHLSGVIG
jgi:hypothetical protein